MSGSQYGVGGRCDCITIRPLLVWGGLYQTSAKSVSGSDSNKGGSSYISYFDGSYSYKNPVNLSVQVILFTARVLPSEQCSSWGVISSELVLWIPSKHPLHHSRREL